MSDFDIRLRMARAAGNTDEVRRLNNEQRDKDAGGHGSYKKSGGSAQDKLDRIHGELKGIDKEDLTTAESKIMGHLSSKSGQKALDAIHGELKGIDKEDLTKAEKNIMGHLGK